jgi:thiol-disulfide isomerase/thioredoxin
MPPVSPDHAASQPIVEVVDTARLLALLAGARQDGPVVMNFWATWCPPCVNEMPVLADFARAYASKGVTVMGVSVDHPDTVDERVRPFVTRRRLPFPVYVLTERSPEAVGKALGVDWGGAVPATFVFDRSGCLIRSWFEEITWSDLTAAVDSENTS